MLHSSSTPTTWDLIALTSGHLPSPNTGRPITLTRGIQRHRQLPRFHPGQRPTMEQQGRHEEEGINQPREQLAENKGHLHPTTSFLLPQMGMHLNITNTPHHPNNWAPHGPNQRPSQHRIPNSSHPQPRFHPEQQRPTAKQQGQHEEEGMDQPGEVPTDPSDEYEELKVANEERFRDEQNSQRKA
ncbi:uncharacterized protein V6R79_018848 [Siganus canaliculatus]